MLNNIKMKRVEQWFQIMDDNTDKLLKLGNISKEIG